MKSKNDYRKFAKELRMTLDILDISESIFNNLKKLPEYKKFKNICTYNSFKNEVCTQKFFLDKSKKWFIPRVKTDCMEVCEYNSDKLSLSEFGIMEPTTQALKALEDIEMVIIPALCVDKSGYRVGYGKGYYDRFFSSMNKSMLKVVLIPEELLVDEIPRDNFDVKCDIIVTQNNIYYV